ncbi:MAG: hypothetical protein AAF518_06540 [Spirochaetota bacterium]
MKHKKRKPQNFLEPMPGYVVLKFYKIEPIPLVSLRNLNDSQHCHQSFLYFYEKLADSNSDSIEEQSIDLEIYESTQHYIQDKYFMYLGYTTNLDVTHIQKQNQDCDHLYYIKFTDIVYGVSMLQKADTIQPYIIDEAELQHHKQNFENSLKYE